MAALNAVRRSVSRDDIEIMVDYNQALTSAEAILRGRELEKEGIYWLEEPIAHEDYEASATVARELKVPLQIGENFNGPEGLLRAISVQASDYFPGIWDTNIIGGTLYGVPWYIDTRLLFYRRDLLAEAGFADPPRSWEEWSRMLAAIKAQVGPERYSVLLPLDEFAPLLVLAIQQPEPLLREDGRYGNFRSPGFRRALAFYREMFQRQWAPPITGTQISNVWDELGRGYYSFYISGPWNIGEFKRRLPPEQQGTWMTAPMPGPDGPGASLAGGSSLVIFRRSRHKQDAWLLLEFLSSPQIQQRFYQLTGDLPPRRSTWRAPELASNVYARAFREQLERVKPTPKVPELERIVTDMRLMAERVVHGDLSVEEGAADLDRDVDAVLQKRRWLLSRGITP